MSRDIYLENIPLEEARERLREALLEAGLWGALPPQLIDVADGLNRVTSAPLWARLSSPHYNASAMDGYAVRSADTLTATETQPITLTVTSGDRPEPPPQSAAEVNTGQPMPAWADAVIMVEHVHLSTDTDGSQQLSIITPLPPWHHVRAMGEDLVATELVIPSDHRLRPVDLGALAAAGIDRIAVVARPRVAIIPTGDELRTLPSIADSPPAPGQIIEFNSIVLAAQVESWGGEASRIAPVGDDPADLAAAVSLASAGHDMVLVCAGSSAGTSDFTASVVRELGQLLVHGVAVRPGHPVILGMMESSGSGPSRQLPIVGVPGYPVSAALTTLLFVKPILHLWQGQESTDDETMDALLTRKILSPIGDDDYVRVALGKVNDRYVASPLSRGAGVISSLARADGLLRVPRFSEGFNAGHIVSVHLLRRRSEIDQTVLAVGSHDLVIDLLSQYLARAGYRLSSSNVGSLSGLMALSRGESHLAGSHLMDPVTGSYNDSYIARLLPSSRTAVVTLTLRDQGWIVPPGNPKMLGGWHDLLRSEVTIANRQRGAGTRVLLDFHLQRLGGRSEQVSGYDREEFTHLAVAAAVASHRADAGLGIHSAARALDLDFIPLAQEPYELVITAAQFDTARMQALLQVLHDEQFRADVAAMPGYDVSPMGEIRWQEPGG